MYGCYCALLYIFVCTVCSVVCCCLWKGVAPCETGAWQLVTCNLVAHSEPSTDTKSVEWKLVKVESRLSLIIASQFGFVCSPLFTMFAVLCACIWVVYFWQSLCIHNFVFCTFLSFVCKWVSLDWILSLTTTTGYVTTSICIYNSLFLYLCICVFVYLCICVFVYLFIMSVFVYCVLRWSGTKATVALVQVAPKPPVAPTCLHKAHCVNSES